MGKGNPWCNRAAAVLTLIYSVFILSTGMYNELTSWGDFWETVSSDLGLLYYTLTLWLVGVCVVTWSKAKVKRMLLPARCHVCPQCLYDLSARPRNDDTCPECGLIAPRRECVRLWCKLLRSRF